MPHAIVTRLLNQAPTLAVAGRQAGVALACMACLAAPLQAAPIHYNFENTGANPAATDNQAHDSLSFTRGGVSVTVTAQLNGGNVLSSWQPVNSTAWAPNTGVYFGNNGLGVKVGATDGTNTDGSDAAYVPGTTDFDEALVFTFSRLVRLTRVNFGDWDGRDNYIGGFNPYLGDQVGIDVDGVNPAYWHRAATDTPTLSLTGMVFRFRADDDATSFRIQDFDVEAVPLPVPGSLALSALGLFSLLAAGAPAAADPRWRPRW